MIKITYTPQLHANFHTGSCAKIWHPSTHQSNKTPIEVTLSDYLSKKMWAMQKEAKEKKKREHSQKHGLDICKSKKKREIAHIPDIKNKRESQPQKRVPTQRPHTRIF
jgi:hypothetical protein